MTLALDTSLAASLLRGHLTHLTHMSGGWMRPRHTCTPDKASTQRLYCRHGHFKSQAASMNISLRSQRCSVGQAAPLTTLQRVIENFGVTGYTQD